MTIKEINSHLPKHLDIEVGDSVRLDIFSNASAGFLPYLVPGKGEAVHALIQTPVQEDRPPGHVLFGACTHHALHIQGVSSGQENVVVLFKRPWVASDENAEKVELTVCVLPLKIK